MTLDSDASSIELEDAAIGVDWDGGLGRANLLPLLPQDDDVPFYERWIRNAKERALRTRIEKFEKLELKTFIAQKLFKTRLILIEKLLQEGFETSSEQQEKDLRQKYGSKLVSWLLDRLLPSISDCGQIIDEASHEYSKLRSLDPLCTWLYSSAEHSTRVLRSIHRAASSMANKVGWSLLVQPGTISCHLNVFLNEFVRLEAFFGLYPLSGGEAAQTSFNVNYLTKARSKVISCADVSRVILKPLRDFNGRVAVEDDHFSGTSDFIHASYVRGGPLMSTFICTQAPLLHTQMDFWRMVWQEKTTLIIMLCGAVDVEKLGPLSNRPLAYCPFYWPRREEENLQFGVFCVKNVSVDGTADPLFNVTHLEVWRKDEVNGDRLQLQHWQWDWRHYSDLHWPFRILRRARLSPTPTIVQCLDGCGRSGTLVSLEVSLMQLIRGSPLPSELVFVSALFTRLQRRHAIAKPLQFEQFPNQYLFIYRCLLHWMEPYVTSEQQRFALGISWWAPRFGFVAKYDKYRKDNTKLDSSS